MLRRLLGHTDRWTESLIQRGLKLTDHADPRCSNRRLSKTGELEATDNRRYVEDQAKADHRPRSLAGRTYWVIHPHTLLKFHCQARYGFAGDCESQGFRFR
jgi:hypothetical protein